MKIVTVVGARPQFIKAAAVSRAIKEHNNDNPDKPIREILVHTGQHYDHNMSEVFFEELDIPHPDYNLGVGSGSHGKQTGQMLEAIEEVLNKEKPDWLLVYGDTNSTLAGALAAAKLHIPIAHVEAGLRSFNRRMPEEINRVLTDHVSSLLFCPTETSVYNLVCEGIKVGVHNVGDVMYDCMNYYLNNFGIGNLTLKKLRLSDKKFVLVTVHRAENTNDALRLSNIFSALNIISEEIQVLVALHPRTKKYLGEYGITVNENIILAEPFSYLQMIALEKNAEIILTDSGGVQKEAFFVKTPCITLREETEWVETVEAYSNTLVGANQEKIIQAYSNIINGRKKPEYSNVYGQGYASKQVLKIMLESVK
ncbi:UDP-N-acetylglucosamine 2-epimerase (non-hydrolyzing) [Desulfotomaculum defluvii]